MKKILMTLVLAPVMAMAGELSPSSAPEAKGKLEQEKKCSLRGRRQALRKPKMEEPSLTEDIEGSTWSYRVCKGAATICSVSPKPAGSISVPAVLGGLPVTAIGERAFIKCEGLTSVMIPSSVSNIGRFAFYDCRGLTTLTIPSGVTSIEDGAFAQCAKLRSVSIPSSVTKIDPSSFSPCNALMTFDVSPENPIYSSADGLLYSKDGKTVVAGLYGKMEIPLGVTTIGHAAFLQREGLNEVMIPPTVTSIGPWAFADCFNLTSVTFPSCVTNIGMSAFGGRNKLSTVMIPTCMTNIVRSAFKRDGTVVATSNGMATVVFNGPKVVRRKPLAKEKSGKTEKVGDYTWSFTIKNGEATIESWQNGRPIKHITEPCAISPCPTGHVSIPSMLGGARVTRIGVSAFRDCTNMTSVTIPASVTNIVMGAFNGCKGLTSIDLPEGLKSIGWMAFSGCTGLKSVTIPANVDNITNAAFSDCGELSRINVSADNQKYASVDGVLYTKDMAKLVQCPAGLVSVTIPKSVVFIEDEAFAGCRKMKSVTIPLDCSSIGVYAFEGCAGLTSVTIPQKVLKIGRFAFAGCEGLTSVTMCGVQPIVEHGIFASRAPKPGRSADPTPCKNLKSIHVPANAKSWAGAKEWQGIPLVFDGDPIDPQKENELLDVVQQESAWQERNQAGLKKKFQATQEKFNRIKAERSQSTEKQPH